MVKIRLNGRTHDTDNLRLQDHTLLDLHDSRL